MAVCGGDTFVTGRRGGSLPGLEVIKNAVTEDVGTF